MACLFGDIANGKMLLNDAGKMIEKWHLKLSQKFPDIECGEYIISGVKKLDWKPFNGKLWHRNYYEHIIRNRKSFKNIRNYIINNPKNWNNHKLHE